MTNEGRRRLGLVFFRLLLLLLLLLKSSFEMILKQHVTDDNVLELWLRWGWPVWPNLRGRKRPGSGSFRRLFPTLKVANWWMSSGCASASCYWPSTSRSTLNGDDGGGGGGGWRVKATTVMKTTNCSSFSTDFYWHLRHLPIRLINYV